MNTGLSGLPNDNRDQVSNSGVEGSVEEVFAAVKLLEASRGDSVSNASRDVLKGNVLGGAAQPVLKPPAADVTPSGSSFNYNFLAGRTQDGADAQAKLETNFTKLMENDLNQQRIQGIEQGGREAVNDHDLNELAQQSGVSLGELAMIIGKPAKEILAKYLGPGPDQLTIGDARQLKLAIAFPAGSSNLSDRLKAILLDLKTVTDNEAKKLAKEYGKDGFRFGKDWDGSAYFNKALYQDEVRDAYDFAFDQALAAAAKGSPPLTKDQVVLLKSMHYAPSGGVQDSQLQALLEKLNKQAAEQVRGAYRALADFTPTANQQFFTYVINGGFLDAFKTAIDDANISGKSVKGKKEVTDRDADMYLANLADPKKPSVPVEIKKQLDACFEKAKNFAVNNFGLQPSWKPEVTSLSPAGVDPQAYAAAKAQCDIADHHIQTASLLINQQPPSPQVEEAQSIIMVYAMAIAAARESLWASNMVNSKMAGDVCKCRIANNKELADKLQKAQEDMQKPTFWQKFTKVFTIIAIAVAAAVVACVAPMTLPFIIAAVALTIIIAAVDCIGACMDPPHDFIGEGAKAMAEAIKKGIGSDTDIGLFFGNALSLCTSAAICLVVGFVNPEIGVSLLARSTAADSLFRMFGAGDTVSLYGSMIVNMGASFAVAGAGVYKNLKNVQVLSQMAQRMRTAANITQTAATLAQSSSNIYTSVIDMQNIEVQKQADLAQIAADAIDQMLKILSLIFTKSIKDMAQLAASLGSDQSDVMRGYNRLTFRG